MAFRGASRNGTGVSEELIRLVVIPDLIRDPPFPEPLPRKKVDAGSSPA
jgi:hypothetical protein